MKKIKDSSADYPKLGKLISWVDKPGSNQKIFYILILLCTASFGLEWTYEKHALKGSDGDDLKKYKFAVTRKRKTGKGIKKNAKKRKMAKSERQHFHHSLGRLWTKQVLVQVQCSYVLPPFQHISQDYLEKRWDNV